MLKSFKIAYEDDLSIFYELINACANYSIISLKGDLAAGKTTLAKAFIQALCSDSANSPTYLKMNEYKINPSPNYLANFNAPKIESIYHYDFYAANSDELSALLYENIMQPGLHLIEWLPNELLGFLKDLEQDILEISIKDDESKLARIYELSRL